MSQAPSKRKPVKHSKSKPAQAVPWQWSHIHLSLFLLIICLFISIIIAASLYVLIALHIPNISSLASYNPPAATIILDKDGHEIGTAYTENRRLKNFSQLPPLLPKAFVAAEDARFYQHPGVDFWSILRALIHNLQSGNRGQGGSTITQQVARALLLSPEKTYTRKIKEAILAYRIDQALSKDEILHIYLNQIYLGERSYGVGAAAETYFGKPVESLNLAQIAILAGLPQAPSSYSPLSHLKRAKIRQAYVLNRMAEDGYISPEAARKAFAMPLAIKSPPEPPPEAGYFVQYVKNYINNKYGASLLNNGGLTVYTTLDMGLQQAAADTLRRGLSQLAIRQQTPIYPPQAALVSIEVKTGKVRALMGGDNFQTSQFDRATQAKRQPGSAFKPVIFAAALESKFTPNTLINDAPIEYKDKNGNIWNPQNFSGKYFGPTTIRNGLVHSRNIVAIKLLQAVGIKKAIDLAKEMGIESKLVPNLSLALGSSEVSLLELTDAYTVFANGGYFQPPQFIEKIVDRNGKILEKNHPARRRVMSKETAYQLTYMMKGVIEEGTGHAARGIKYAAGKTGTTDHYMDAWFIGYTPDLAAGVWVGHDQYKSLGPNETGGRAAAPIWKSFMKKAKSYSPTHDFVPPPGISFIPIARQSGDFEYKDPDQALWEAFKKKNLSTWENRRREESD